jgi:acetylglutamate kinase
VTTPLVLKLGGELLDTAADRTRVAHAAAAAAARRPLVIVHGGGRAIDAELDRRGIAPRKVDGLRVTDADTLDAVVAVLAGSANTDLVASLVGAGVAAVGLTGADAGFARANRSSAYRTTSGADVDLGYVGSDVVADAALLSLLIGAGYVPVVASLGLDRRPAGAGASLLNVNADVMACAIAAAFPGSELVIAGTTPGVLDAAGRTIATLDTAAVGALVASGTATAGMIAKLSACRTAIDAGAGRVRIIDGRAIGPDAPLDRAPGTTLTAAAPARAAELQGAATT